MQKALIITAILFSILACKNDPSADTANGDTPTLASIEAQFESENTPENLKALLDAYSAEVTAHPEETEKNVGYLNTAAQQLIKLKRYSSASNYLQRIIKEYHSSPQAAAAANTLAGLYENNLEKKDNALTIYQSMASSFPSFENLGEITSKIPEGTLPIVSRIQEMSKSMFDAKEGKLNYKIASNYLQNCELFAMMNPKDENSPVLLSKGAEVARSMRSFTKALDIYKWIYTAFPNSKEASQALFLNAFTLDNEFHKQEEAKVLYEEFLAKYPNDEFADDTQFLLKNLGKSEEQLIKEFEAKLKK